MTKRTPEEVHTDGGHDERAVKSCSLCHPADAETKTADEAGTEQENPPEGEKAVLGTVEEFTGDPDSDAEPLPPADPAGYAEDSEPLAAERLEYVNGRVKCYLGTCPLPEFADGTGLCGGHWSTRPDLRRVARHG